MFKSPRYMTRGIQEEVGLDLQLFLWSFIDERAKSELEMDYLQFFELTVTSDQGKPVQNITHRQEVPAFSKTHQVLGISRPLNSKIWVIDDKTATTMLFPSEY